jgi:hypothetical protein
MKIGDKVRVKLCYHLEENDSNSNTYIRRGQTGKLLAFGVNQTYVKFDIDDKYLHVYTDALELIEDKFVIPEKWYINVTTKEQAEVVGRWFDQSEFGHSDNYYETNASLGIYGGVSPGNVYDNEVGTEITFEQFEKYILKQNNKKKEIIGYKSPMAIGPFTKGTLYVKYIPSYLTYVPEAALTLTYSVPNEIVETWEPVYKEDQTKTLVLGTGRIKVVIGKGKIDVDNGNVIEFDSLKIVYDLMVGGNDRRLNIVGTSTDYSVSFPKGVKIGCSEFEYNEIKQIIDTYNELNK